MATYFTAKTERGREEGVREGGRGGVREEGGRERRE